MKNVEWKDKIAEFKKVDVRGVAGNFFPGLKKQAAELMENLQEKQDLLSF